MSKKIIIGGLLGVLIIVGALQVFFSSENSNLPAQKLTIAATQTALLVWIAQEQGFFAKNGLDVIILKEQGGHLAIRKVLSGEAEVSTSSEFVLVNQSFLNKDLKTFGTVATADNVGVVGRKDRGIETPSDLSGKKIGVTKNSAGDFFLGTFLTFNNIPAHALERVGMNPQKIQESVVNGEIDGGITWDPFAYQIQQALGENAVRFNGQSGQDFHFLLISQSQWLQEHPDLAKRLIKALVETEQYLKTSKTEAQELAIQKFKYEPQYLKYAWDQQNFVVSLPQSLLTAMDDAARWKIDTKQTDQTTIPNYLNYIYFDALDAIKPDGITIIR